MYGKFSFISIIYLIYKKCEEGSLPFNRYHVTQTEHNVLGAEIFSISIKFQTSSFLNLKNSHF